MTDFFFHNLGLNAPFIEAPSNPTYAVPGSNAILKWNFTVDASFKRVEIEYQDSGSFKLLVWKTKDGTVSKNPNVNLPNNLTSRITIEGTATFIISNFNAGDANEYRCRFVPFSGSPTTQGPVQLSVTGKNCGELIELVAPI